MYKNTNFMTISNFHSVDRFLVTFDEIQHQTIITGIVFEMIRTAKQMCANTGRPKRYGHISIAYN